MIEGWHPVTQTLLGTLLTWGLTAAGAAVVFFCRSTDRKLLDVSLGFAAGVMTAASYWSLLAPAIEMAEDSGLYGAEGQYAFFPAVIGFLIGAVFIYCADVLLPSISGHSSGFAMALNHGQQPTNSSEFLYEPVRHKQHRHSDVSTLTSVSDADWSAEIRRRLGRGQSSLANGVTDFSNGYSMPDDIESNARRTSWSRVLLLIVAITIHNIPEGLAVGVGFGAIGKTELATFENARNLAVGIGIQNFPEGLAVSLPLKGAGFSSWKSFWYGQLSGMVEPVAGLLGVILVSVAEPLLPYALSFAAGAMIFVVVDDIIPESNACGNGRLASWGAIVGFSTMMALDVGLG